MWSIKHTRAAIIFFSGFRHCVFCLHLWRFSPSFSYVFSVCFLSLWEDLLIEIQIFPVCPLSFLNIPLTLSLKSRAWHCFGVSTVNGLLLATCCCRLFFPSCLIPNSCNEQPNSWHRGKRSWETRSDPSHTNRPWAWYHVTRSCLHELSGYSFFVFQYVWFHDFLLPWLKHTQTHTHIRRCQLCEINTSTHPVVWPIWLWFLKLWYGLREAPGLGTSPKTGHKPCSGALMCLWV